MNCFCDRNFTPVAGVGQWDWGSFAQDVVKAGLQVGTTYAASELGGSRTTTPGVNPALVNPYGTIQQPVYMQPAAAGTPSWVWPVVIGAGLLVTVVMLKSKR